MRRDSCKDRDPGTVGSFPGPRWAATPGVPRVGRQGASRDRLMAATGQPHLVQVEGAEEEGSQVEPLVPQPLHALLSAQ